MSEYIVIYEQAEDGGWGAYLPDLPGVVALGSTREQVAQRIQEALTAYAEDLQQRGAPCRRRTTRPGPSRPKAAAPPRSTRQRRLATNSSA